MTSSNNPTPQTPQSAAHQKRSNSFRGRHRSLSDQAAHNDDKPFTPPPILDHPLVCADEPTLITTPDQLDEAVDHLRSAKTFGYDTEFIGEDSYYPYLCVIQAATTERVILFDPIAMQDLSSWWALLNDPALTKIVHAGAQDIEPVMRLTGKPAANLFDTQVVGGLVGLDHPLSLGNTIQAILGVEHDAGAKFSRWDRRPLTPQQIHYAAGDVRYLCAIHDWMKRKLEELDNTEFAKQACEDLCEPQQYIADPLSRKIKAKGINKLSRKKRAAFNALLLWREELSQQLNVTPRGLISDEAAYAIADELPRDPDKLASVKFVPRPVAQDHGQAIIDTVAQALQGPLPPKHQPPSYNREDHRAAVNALWDRIAERCAERSITPSVVTSKRELGPLVAATLEGRPVPQLSVNTGWRKELLGSIVDDEMLVAVE